MAKPKILYIVTQGSWGGAQKYVFDLAANLTDEFEVTVAAGSDGAELFYRLPPTIKTHIFKRLKREIRPLSDLAAVFQIARFLKREKFDLVHLNSSKAGLIGALANALAGHPSKVLFTAHGWVYLEVLPWLTKKLYVLIEMAAAYLRDYTIVLCEREKKIASLYETAKENSVAVIPHGLDLVRLNFWPRNKAREILALDAGKDGWLVGAIANNYLTKGLSYLDEAAAALKNKGVRVVVIGEQFEEEWPNLITLGAKPDAYQYLKAFDIFVLPSTKEGFPYVILEAMAAGVPIVATSIGAIPEILEDKKSGLLVNPADSRALAQAVLELLGDENLRHRLAAAALRKSKNFDFQNTLEKTKALYSSLLKTKELGGFAQAPL